MYIFIYFFCFFHFLIAHPFPFFQGRGRNRADLNEERRRKGEELCLAHLKSRLRTIPVGVLYIS